MQSGPLQVLVNLVVDPSGIMSDLVLLLIREHIAIIVKRRRLNTNLKNGHTKRFEYVSELRP